MPIRRFLQDRPFDHEAIAQMSEALQRACDVMRLRNNGDMATELVAEKIIELAQRGVVGADNLSTLAVKELTGE